MNRAPAISPPDSLPTVSVVIPHFSDLPSLALCLDALERATLPRDRFEVIVADNASPEGRAAVEAVIAGRGRLIIVAERGAGPTRNGGAAAAQGEILAFTDCDCLPEPDWLAAGVAALGRSDVIGGRMEVLTKDPDAPTPVEAFESVFAFDNETYVRRKGFTVSANLFCARAVFETVGGFGVGLSEDVDWCRRAAALGFSLDFEARAVVGHPARRDWADLIRKWRRIDSESFALIKTEPFGSARWWVRSLSMPASAVAHAPRVLFTNKLSGFVQRVGALKVLIALRSWRSWDCLRLAATGR